MEKIIQCIHLWIGQHLHIKILFNINLEKNIYVKNSTIPKD